MESNADIEEPELQFPGPLCGPVTQNFFRGNNGCAERSCSLSPKQWLFCYLERVISPWRNSLAEHHVTSSLGGTAKHGLEQNCAPSIIYPSPRGSSSIIGLFLRPLCFNGKGQVMETSKALFHQGLVLQCFACQTA